jgi:putative ABC transport system permease protein
MALLVRVKGSPSVTVPSIREAVREIDPAQAVYYVRTLDEWLDESASQPRVTSILAGAFALMALLLAAVGIYGVLSYSVGQRTREIGVRMAMGAGRGQVVRLVLRGALMWVGSGIALGLLGAFALNRVVASLLFDVPARNPVTFAAVGTTLALVALAACYAPVARATRINPILALRSE